MTVRESLETVREGLYRQIGRVHGHVQESRELPVDVAVGESEYLVIFDAPGVSLDDVQVRYIDGTIRVRFDRVREFYDGYEMRFPGRATTMEGVADLPDDALVDPDRATATLTERGTIRIDIPRGNETDAETAPGERASDEVTFD